MAQKQPIECRFVGISKLRSGVCKLTLELHPDDAAAAGYFFALPIGQPIMAVFQPYTEDTQNVSRETSEEHRPFYTLPRPKQAALLCKDSVYREWRHAEDEDHAKELIYARFDIGSRAELSDPRFEHEWNGHIRAFDDYKRHRQLA